MRITLVMAALGALVVAGPAFAEAPAHPNAARDHYELGLAAFRAGHYDQAITELDRAYAAQPLPGLLLDLGACYRRQGNSAQALRYYRQYLSAASPGAPGRGAAEQAIAELTGAAHAAPRAPASAPVAESWLRTLDDEPAPLGETPTRASAARRTDRPARFGPLFYVGVALASTGVAALAVGIAGNIEAHEYGAAVSADSRSPTGPVRFNDPSLAENDRDYERQGHTWNTVGIVGTTVGAGLAVGGAALILWDRALRRKHAHPSRAWYLVPQAGPRTAGLGGGLAW